MIRPSLASTTTSRGAAIGVFAGAKSNADGPAATAVVPISVYTKQLAGDALVSVPPHDTTVAGPVANPVALLHTHAVIDLGELSTGSDSETSLSKTAARPPPGGNTMALLTTPPGPGICRNSAAVVAAAVIPATPSVEEPDRKKTVSRGPAAGMQARSDATNAVPAAAAHRPHPPAAPACVYSPAPHGAQWMKSSPLIDTVALRYDPGGHAADSTSANTTRPWTALE
jgi:hypothetical protein